MKVHEVRFVNPKITVSDAFEMYRRNYMTMKGQSAKTEQTYNTACKLLIDVLGDVDLTSITFNHVRKWKTEIEKSRSADTVRLYIVCLRVILGYFLERGHQVINPNQIPVPKRRQKVPEFMTPQEITQFIKIAGHKRAGLPEINRVRNITVLCLLYASGVRVSELHSLDRNSIRDSSFTIVGKGGKPRLCFIDKRTEKHLNQYLKMRKDTHKALFVNSQGTARMSIGTVQEVFRNVCKNSDFDNIHPHVFRHSYATNLLRNNTNLRYVQEFLGHSSLETTQMYTHVTNFDLQKIYEKKHTI